MISKTEKHIPFALIIMASCYFINVSANEYDSYHEKLTINDITAEYKQAIDLLESDIEDYIKKVKEKCNNFEKHNDENSPNPIRKPLYSKERLDIITHKLNIKMNQLENTLASINSILNKNDASKKSTEIN